jgi:hypothetical protein
MNRSRRNLWYIAALMGAALAWGMAGCCGSPSDPACRPITVGQAETRFAQLSDQITSLKQPTPAAPIDYSARFDAIDQQLAKIAERSVAVPPKPEPIKKKVCCK